MRVLAGNSKEGDVKDSKEDSKDTCYIVYCRFVTLL